VEDPPYPGVVVRPRSPFLCATLVTALAASPALAADVGDPVDEAIAVHLGSSGLDQLGEAVARVMPEQLRIDASSGQESCAESDAVPLDWSLDQLDILLSIDHVAIDTTDGDIALTIYATMASTASELTVTGDCTVLTELDEVCDVELPTTAIQVSMGIEIVEIEGAFDVTVADPTVDISPLGNPLSDCTFASAIGTMLGQDPLLLSGLIESLVAPELDALGPTIEEPLEDALSQLQIETSLDLLGTTLDVEVYPTALTMDETGLVLGLGATVTPGAISDCVDPSSGIELRDAGWPAFGPTAPGSSLPYDAGLFVGADFLDQALFSVWASGALCLDAGALLGSTLPAGLTTDFLGALLGDEFTALFPESKPATLLISAPVPPRGGFDDDGAPLHILADSLTVDLYAELDHRQTRVFEVQGDADIGLDISLEDNTLVTGLVLEDPAVDFAETYHELIGPGYSEGLAALVGTLLSGLIPTDLLPSIAVPEILGARLDQLIWLPDEDAAWQGGFVLLDLSGVEPIELTGCSLDGFGCDGGDLGVELDLETILGCDTEAGLGCEDSTCTTGASAAVGTRAARGRLALLLALVGGLGLRRRRSSEA